MYLIWNIQSKFFLLKRNDIHSFIHSNQYSTSIEIITYSNSLKTKNDESANKLAASELIP
jgi:hypothetical protein